MLWFFHFQTTFHFWKYFHLCYILHNLRIRNKKLTISIWLLHFLLFLESNLWTISKVLHYGLIWGKKEKKKIPEKKDLEFPTLFCVWASLGRPSYWFSLSIRSCILYTYTPRVRLLSQSSYSKPGITPALTFLAFLPSTIPPSLDLQIQGKQELFSPAVRERPQAKLYSLLNAVDMKLFVKQVWIPRQAAVSRNGLLCRTSVLRAIANVAPMARNWQSIRHWSGIDANYMLNTYFTAEVPNESQQAQFCIMPFTFHRNWMHQVRIIFF